MTTPYGPPMAMDPLVALLLRSGGGPYGAVHEGLGAPPQPVSPPAGWQGDYAHVPALQTANQPGTGYLDALAMALQGNEINVPTQRYKGDSGGFGVGLISGLEHGFSTSRLADMQHRQALQNALTQQAHDTNAANSEASKEQRAFEFAKALKAAPDGKTDEPTVNVVGPDGKPVVSTRTAAIGKIPFLAADVQKPDNAVESVVDPKTGKPVFVLRSKAVGMQPYEKPSAAAAGAGSFDPSQYVDTSPLGFQYVNVNKIPNAKDKQAATDYARTHGLVPVGDREQKAIDLVDEARGNLQAMDRSSQGLLPANGVTRIGGGPLNWLQATTQIGPHAADLKAFNGYRTAAISAIQGIGGLGTGLRINQAEVNQALKNNVPENSDAADVAAAKLRVTTTMLDNVERAILTARNPRAAAAQAGSGAGAAAPPAGESEADVVKRLGLKQVSTPVKAHTRAVR